MPKPLPLSRSTSQREGGYKNLMSESAEITRSKFPLFGVWEASLGGRSERNLARQGI